MKQAPQRVVGVTGFMGAGKGAVDGRLLGARVLAMLTSVRCRHAGRGAHAQGLRAHLAERHTAGGGQATAPDALHRILAHRTKALA